MRPFFPGSIHARLTLAASLVLGAFLGLTGLALDQAYSSSAEQALKTRLQSDIYALLAAGVEDDHGRFTMPALLTDPSFNRPDSGRFAEARGDPVGYTWRSASTLGGPHDFIQPTEPGEAKYRIFDADGATLMSLSFGIVWTDDNNLEIHYTLAVAEDLADHGEQISAYRNTLLSWLGGVALLLLLAQGLVLRWGLQPLRSVAEELKAIESGEADGLTGRYPRELRLLTDNINSLIQHARTRQQRYRDSLGDLAHSLKTPLAILQTLVERKRGDEDGRAFLEQVERMNQIVSHQLQRASASGRKVLIKPLPVRPVVERIAQSLHKVYAEKPIAWNNQVDEQAQFFGDEGDMMEIFGNLMDNAWKYGRTQVLIRTRPGDKGVSITVEDDGPGIPPDQTEMILARGGRIDMTRPGQGIGLAVVADILKAYGGALEIGRGEFGGACFTVKLPV